MKLVYIHGAPASGKLTVARELAKRVSGRLCDNHASIDLARTLFDFGAPGFWPLTNRLRRVLLESALEFGIETLIWTECFADPEDLPWFEKVERMVHEGDGQICPVFLECAGETLLARVGSPDRTERGKIASAATLDVFMKRWNITAVPRGNVLRVRSDELSAADAALAIIDAFGLEA